LFIVQNTQIDQIEVLNAEKQYIDNVIILLFFFIQRSNGFRGNPDIYPDRIIISVTMVTIFYYYIFSQFLQHFLLMLRSY